MRKSKSKFIAMCECGHNHVCETGDNGPNHDELRYEIIFFCPEQGCQCTEFIKAKKLKKELKE